METNSTGWRVQLAAGATFVVMACAAAAVDLINNFAYGIAISHTMAGVMVIAALGVVAIPAVAAARGWCWLKALALAVAVAMTVYCADRAYSSNQEKSSLKLQTINQNYEKAKEKETRAKEVLKNIKEIGSAKELGIMAAQADTKQAEAEAASKKACARRRSYACRLAEDGKKAAQSEAKLAHERLSRAEARDKAEADLASAEEKSAGGQTILYEESQVLTWLSIALTQLVALLGGEGFAMIGGAIHTGEQQPPKARKPIAPVQLPGSEQEPLAANVVPLSARRHSVEAWLRNSVMPGGELRGGDALKAYRRWPEADASLTGDELRKALIAIYGDKVKARTSGYTVRGIQLRAGMAGKMRTVRA